MSAEKSGIGLWAALVVVWFSLGGRSGAQGAAPSLPHPLIEASRAAGPGVRLAYFYKPPLDETTPEFLAQHFELVILTQNDEEYRDRLRTAGFERPVLQYVAADAVEGPGPYANRTARCDSAYDPLQKTAADARGVFCRAMHPHEGWFLHNARGERLYTQYRSSHGEVRTFYYTNPRNAEWRRFYADKLYSYIGRLRYDGFFLDNVHLSRNALLHDPANRGGLSEYANDATYRNAVLGMLRELRRGIGARPLWANLVNDPGGLRAWQPYFMYLDGVMIEDFATGWRGLAMSERERREQLEKVRDALARGKEVIAVAQGDRNDRDRLTLGLASYWLLNNGHLYFRYADWKEKAYRTVWWYPDYERSPGSPRGKLVEQEESWKREFDAAEVRVNLSSGEGELTGLANDR